MNHQRLLGSSMALLAAAAGVAAHSSRASDFAIEMALAERPPAGQTIEARCLRGCEWEAKTLECPKGDHECRIVIANTEHEPAVKHEPAVEPKPLSGSVCLGVRISHDPDTRYKVVEDRLVTDNSESVTSSHVEISSRAIVGEVAPASPADLAGFKAGDVVTAFNGVAIERRIDFIKMIHGLGAGQPFEAVLDRNGTPVSVRGRTGMQLSNYKCAPVDSQLLQRPTITAKVFASDAFKLAIDVPGTGASFRCLRGCIWTEVSASDLHGLRGCWVEVNPHSIGGSCPRNPSKDPD